MIIIYFKKMHKADTLQVASKVLVESRCNRWEKPRNL